MQIEVFSDIVCPWCYAGFARLEQALAQRPGTPFRVTWLPFELNPDLPSEGMERSAYLLQRFGDVNRFAAGQQQLRELGHELGIDYRFERVARMPNTRRAHVLLAWARRGARQSMLKRALLAAYFTEGRDVGDPQVLVAIAGEAGLDAGAARAALEDRALHEEVAMLEEQARSWNVSGVPTFVFARRYGFSGAQPTEAFLETIDAAAAAADGAH